MRTKDVVTILQLSQLPCLPLFSMFSYTISDMASGWRVRGSCFTTNGVGRALNYSSTSIALNSSSKNESSNHFARVAPIWSDAASTFTRKSHSNGVLGLIFVLFDAWPIQVFQLRLTIARSSLMRPSRQFLSGNRRSLFLYIHSKMCASVGHGWYRPTYYVQSLPNNKHTHTHIMFILILRTTFNVTIATAFRKWRQQCFCSTHRPGHILTRAPGGAAAKRSSSSMFTQL